MRSGSHSLLPALAAGAVGLAVALSCGEGPPTSLRPEGEPTGRVAIAAGDPVLVGAGDIASCTAGGDSITAALLDAIDGAVFTAGDNAYPNGTTQQFQDCYDPTWGRHKSRTRPAPGNHDYYTAGAAPYFAYFGASAGQAGKGYYSYELGAWHIIVLNSNIAAGPGSAQANWLRSDLAGHPTDCAAAYWHHAVFSSGKHGPYNAMMADLWEILDAAGVDVVLAAHDHFYERFAPQTATGVADPNGIREFVVGTGGGQALYAFETIASNSQVRNNTTRGVLKLTLHAASYDWIFVPEPGKSFTDSGTAACVETSPSGGNGAPIADSGGPYSGQESSAILLDGTGSQDPDGDLLTHAWTFGDGTVGTGATVPHTYDDDGSYAVTLTVTDPGGLSGMASATATVTNVAPTATFNAPNSIPRGTSYTLSLTNSTDLSGADRAAGFTHRFDCGSGYGSWKSASSVTCPGISTDGSHRVRAKIRDKDMGVRSYRRDITIGG